MRSAIVNGKRYQVSHVFNMVGNFYFNRMGIDYLVDTEDVANWLVENDLEYKNGLVAAIEYAKDLSEDSEDGVFWWKEKESE